MEWKISYYCFTYTKKGFYKFLIIFFGIPLSFLWGILFALFSFTTVWFCTPSLQLFKIILQSIRSFYSVVIETLIAPLYEAAGLLFSRINIKFNFYSFSRNDQSEDKSKLYPVLYNNEKKDINVV